MTCKDCRELFADAYYDEMQGEERTAFEAHIASCDECKSEYRRVEKTLTLMGQRERVEPDEEYWSGYWQALKSKIESGAQPENERTMPVNKVNLRPAFMPSWAYGIAAMLLIGIGVYLGRTMFVPKNQEILQPSGDHTVSSKVSPDSLSKEEVEKQVNMYLDRSRALLLGLINTPAKYPSSTNFTRQQQVSRELIQQASYLETKLGGPDRERFRKLIGDLGVILRELANYSVENSVPLIELVKQGVDKKSILLKINLEQIRALDSQTKLQERTTKDNHKSKI